MVECTALEMRRAREGTQGSNPCLSANSPEKPCICWEWLFSLAFDAASGTKGAYKWLLEWQS